jgi:hypothetical protein
MSDERDETRQFPPSGEAAHAKDVDDTMPGRAADDTAADAIPPVRGEATAPFRRPDATAMMPAVTDDWAPSRGNPAWSGRAEVRAPLPGGTDYPEGDDWPAGIPRAHRDRWWMPIVVGIVVLVLLAALGWGLYLIVQNSGGSTTPTTPVSAAPHQVTATTASALASTEPTTEPATTVATTEPTTEVTIPALRGLALADAQAALGRTGLRWRVIEHADDAPAGTVIDSDPAEGQEVPPATRVTLVVSTQTTTPATTATTTATTDGSGVDDDGADDNGSGKHGADDNGAGDD